MAHHGISDISDISDISQGAVAPESPRAVVENWVRSHTSPERSVDRK